MAHNDISMFPRGIRRMDAVSSAAKVITAAPMKIVGILMSEQAGAAEVVRFRQADDAPVHFTYNLPASTTVYLEVDWYIEDLEVKLDDAGNVDVTVFYEAGGSTIDVV